MESKRFREAPQEDYLYYSTIYTYRDYANSMVFPFLLCLVVIVEQRPQKTLESEDKAGPGEASDWEKLCGNDIHNVSMPSSNSS